MQNKKDEEFESSKSLSGISINKKDVNKIILELKNYFDEKFTESELFSAGLSFAGIGISFMLFGLTLLFFSEDPIKSIWFLYFTSGLIVVLIGMHLTRKRKIV